jgi:tryptophan-rich sensory protein
MIGFVILSLLAGFLGTLVTITGPDSWFALELIKPAWQPPNFLFAPVWTTLYILMGIAAGYIFAQGWEKKEVKIATVIFLIQLGLNVLWSYMFFGWHMLLGSTIEIAVLLVMICVTMYLYYRIKPVAAYLLIPYVLWVSFATVLTAAIWMMNPGM